jgi:class 3 adenylate cyclase
MLLLSALLSIVMGIFVATVGQERRIKLWFFLLCMAAAALSLGLWIEVNLPRWSFAAARVNMSSALLIAICGLVSVRTLYGLPLRASAVILMMAAAAVNIGTVWLTEVYFTGELIHYPWGVYVAGDPKFVINPLLVTAIAFWGLVNLWTQYRTAHPLDRNRAKYIFLSNLLFAASALDYLPHFGIDLFGGPVSGIAIPSFLAVYGYAMLRFRLFEFHALVGRLSGWLLAAVMLGATYALVVEGGRRFGLSPARTYVIAAMAAFAVWLILARQIPAWAHRLLSGEPDFMAGVNNFSDQVIALLDEGALRSKWAELCVATFSAEQAWFVQGRHFTPAVVTADILERESERRAGRGWPDAASNAELLLPLRRGEALLGAVAIGPRRNGRMYPQAALYGLRYAANVFCATLASIRAATEIEKRHLLDRYLAPQFIDGILSGSPDTIERKCRLTITVFFSDLKGFSDIADRLDPDALSVIMNDYLAEMADIAFAHGGTVDKFIGDAVMVLFGAPIGEAVGTQVRQCVAMAMEMHRRSRELNRRWRAAGLLKESLISRMGIHTGEATVGSFGSRTRADYTALGRNVNLASRLETACVPGRILVSADSWRHLRGAFLGACRGTIAVKGRNDPIEVYEINPEPGTDAACWAKGEYAPARLEFFPTGE